MFRQSMRIKSDLLPIFSERFSRLTINKKHRELAELYNVSSSAISNWKNGKTMPSIDMLWNIAVFEEVTIDWLIGLSDNMKNELLFL
ncbi:MAG: helix-turn-helix transcriptional regulator [Thioploca sp.]|nr:helix-turn-helix transcriptional regulator [Thioploca sp.]